MASAATDLAATAKMYDTVAELENDRLRTHPMERELTFDAIAAHVGQLAAAGQPALKIADIGGATGGYAFRLADWALERGLDVQVHLRDLSPGLIDLALAEQARRKGSVQQRGTLASIAVGSALDMELFSASEAGTFDAVLLLGPLYHLVDPDERTWALKYALNLLRRDCAPSHPAPLVFAAFITSQAHLRDIAIRAPARLATDRAFYAAYLGSGNYVKTGAAPRSSHHTKSPDEVGALVAAAGGELVELFGAESVLGGALDAKLVDASPEVLAAWVDVMRPLAREPWNLGAADHWVAVVKPT